jgi:HK97 family phage prohead protease
MTMMRGVFAAEIRELGDDEVEVVISTGVLARDGHILEPAGAQLDNYRKNPIFLWVHDQKIPVGVAEAITVEGDKITARVRFAPIGVSAEADKVRGLVKSGIVRSVSVGFDAIEGEPLDPRKPKGGQRFTRWELLECSFVSVPADPGAVVTAREFEGSPAMTETTEGAAAAAAAAAPKPVVLRAHRGGVGVMVRSLYDIGRLAWLLDSLCDAKWSAEFEAALEGDTSAVPALLAKAMQNLGAALIAMTEEEVAEALAGIDDDGDEGEGLDAESTTIIFASKTPELKRFRIGYHRVARLMKRDDDGDDEITMAAVISACREHLAHHEAAMDHHRAGLRAHRRAADCIRGIPGVADGDENNSQQVQTSAGTGESEGSDNGRAVDLDRRRRLADLQHRQFGA